MLNLAVGQNLCWEAVVYDSNIFASNGTPLMFDVASKSRLAPRVSFAQGCFAQRQTQSFNGDMELVHGTSGPNNYFNILGQVQNGPMSKSWVIALISLTKMNTAYQVGGPLSKFWLDPTLMVALAPTTMDHLGNYQWTATTPLGQIPDNAIMAGSTIYGQYAAISSDWMDPNIYMTNGVELQLPLYWNANGGPAVTTISAKGTSAKTGTIKQHYGLVISVGP